MNVLRSPVSQAQSDSESAELVELTLWLHPKWCELSDCPMCVIVHDLITLLVAEEP
jgi:hypothetical protein